MGDGDLAMWLFRNLEEAATEEAFNEKWTCFTNICEAFGNDGCGVPQKPAY